MDNIYAELARDIQASSKVVSKTKTKSTISKIKGPDESQTEIAINSTKTSVKKKRAQRKSRSTKDPPPIFVEHGSSNDRKQQIKDFWDGEHPKDKEVDTDLVDSMTAAELMIDNEDIDEPSDRATPLWDYSKKAQKTFWNHVDKYTLDVDKQQKDLRRVLVGDDFVEKIGSPIFLPTGHSHDEVKMPLTLTADIFGRIDKKDDDRTPLMTENEKYHLARSRHYESFENYIAPKIMAKEMKISREVIEGTFKEIDDKMGPLMGVKADGIQHIWRDKTKAIYKKTSAFVLCYPASTNRMFFLGVVLRLVDSKSDGIVAKHYYRTKHTTVVDKYSESVMNLKMKYVTHLYFVCECREGKDNPKA